MRGKTLAAISAASLVGALLAQPLTATEVGAQPPSHTDDASGLVDDTRPTTWSRSGAQKYDVLRQAALEKQLRGDVPVDREVVKLGKGRFSKVAHDGHRPDLRRARRVREHAALRVLRQHRPGGLRLPLRRHPDPLRRSAPQRDPEAGPHGRQQHELAEPNYNRPLLRGHLLQPDGEVLRGPVLGCLLRRR